jgi:hypothetical protein
LKLGPVDPLRLWGWLRPFDEATGFSRDVRKAVHEHIRTDDALRRAIQSHVLFEEHNEKTLWARVVRLTSRSPGFQPTNDDVLLLFDRLSRNEREGDQWKDLVRLVRHSDAQGQAVRERAKAFVANRPDMLAWIDRLAESHEPEWTIKQAKERRRREAKRAMEWQEHRKNFQRHIEEMRTGGLQWLVGPAQAYLGEFQDVGQDCPAHDRVEQWLGEELAQAAHAGFAAFLLSSEPPTAQQVADSYADSKSWPAAKVIVAGLAERWRRLRDGALADISDDRLLTTFHELRYSTGADRPDLAELEVTVASEIERRSLFEVATRQWIEPQLAARRDHVDQLYSLVRDEGRRALSVEVAEEWLDRFPDIALGPELELLECLLRYGRFHNLRTLWAERQSQSFSVERRANWDAIAFVVDNQRERLEAVARANPNWFWVLRGRLGAEGGRTVAPRLTIAQLGWMFATFRGPFPRTGYPSGAWSGDTNAWDASDFLLALIDRLADDTSDDATRQLVALRDAPPDGYTDALRARAAEQARKAVQERYRPVPLTELRAILDDQPPTSVADLQATMLALLEAAQARIRSSPDDAWRGFYDDQSEPRDEERCRDHLLTVLGLHPEGIDLLPEGHLADDKRADIIALRPGLRLPIEIKGQWHTELWRAADSQLERLYAADYAAERRGIYLVLWFGHAVRDGKKPRARAVGQRRPQSPEELLQGLTETSEAGRACRIKVVVLELSRAAT